MPRRLRSIVVLVVVALVAAGCGGDSSSSAGFSVPPSSSPASDQVVEGEDPGASAGSEQAGAPPEVEVEVVEAELSDFESPAILWAAERATETLGDAALDAVAGAIARGYSAAQIIGALGAGSLQPDGAIEETKPLGEPSDALDITALGAVGGARSSGVVPIAIREGGSVRDALLALGADFDSANPSKGAIVLLLHLVAMGYTADQITELLIAAESFEFRRVPSTDDATSYEGGTPHTVQVDSSCLLLFDVVTGEPVLPALTPETTPCRRAVWRLRNDGSEVVFVEGGLSSGPILQAETIAEVVRNELGFELDFDSGLVNGDGTVTRRAVIPRDDCDDEKISPLGFTFQGRFVDDVHLVIEGEFWYRVKAEEYVDLDACEDTLSRWGTGRGTWSAEWDPDARRLAGELTASGGSFATNTFELTAVD